MCMSNCKTLSNLDNLDNIFSQEIINPVHSMRQATWLIHSYFKIMITNIFKGSKVDINK